MESVWKKSEILHAEPSQKTESNRTDNEEEEDEVVRIWTWGRVKVGLGQKVLATKSKGDNLGQRRSEERIACQERTSLTTPFVPDSNNSSTHRPHPAPLVNSVLMTAKIEWHLGLSAFIVGSVLVLFLCAACMCMCSLVVRLSECAAVEKKTLSTQDPRSRVRF